MAGAYLSNMDENGFNGVGNPFCFTLQNQDDKFVRDSAQIDLFIKDNYGFAKTVDEIVYDSTLGQLCTTDDIVTSTANSGGFDNVYTIELKAKTMYGNVVDSNFVLFVGRITLTVSLRRSDGSVYTGNTSVSLCYPGYGRCATEYHNNSSGGNVVFTNIPSFGPSSQYTLNGGGSDMSFTVPSDGYSLPIEFTIE